MPAFLFRRLDRFDSLRLGSLLLAALFLSLAVRAPAQGSGPRVAWHWHMHQPIYWNDQLRAGGADRYEYAWESIQQKDSGAFHPTNNLREIFGKDDRVAAYQWRTRDSVDSIRFSHPRSGVQLSYSGALMENVNSLGQAGQMGYSGGWAASMNEANEWDTPSGHPRMDIVNFSFHHALLGLHNPETVEMELRLHQEKVKEVFGADALSRGFFPSEMAFSERLIPVLTELGIDWAIVSGEHIARACPDFPLQLGSGGVNCDPPNLADQINPNGVDFIREQISRGCGPVNANPLSYQPAYAKYVDPETGAEHKIVVIPSDQAQSWKDGFQCIGAEFLDALQSRNDPDQPSLVLLAHDGDNAFGGGFSYYHECVPNLAGSAASKGGVVSTVEQYLSDFPPDPANVIHVEDGAWVNADSDFGSPSFINWNYPLIDPQGNVDPVNGWHEKPRDMAIFTAALNRVLTAQQISGHEPVLAEILHPDGDTHPVDRAWHYHLGSLDSGNVYFGPVEDLEIKATIGANEAVEHADPVIGDASGDLTPPTIWLPQRHPYNPGSLNFGVQYGYREFLDDGDFHVWTFIYDVSGPVTATLKYRRDADGANPLSSNQNETYAGGAEVGAWIELPMARRAFPKDQPAGYNNGQIDFSELPAYISDHFSVEIAGEREVLLDYYIEATDAKGNVARSPIQHVWVGDGEGGTGGGNGGAVTVEPSPPVKGQQVTITYDPTGRNLDDAAQVYIHHGESNWSPVFPTDPAMSDNGDGTWSFSYTVGADASQIDMVFNDGAGTWDNNGGQDWHFATVSGEATEPPVASFSASPTSGDAPLTVTFTNASTGIVTSREWDFDNNGTVDSTSSGNTVLHTYDTPGTYSASLTVGNSAGEDTETKVDFIVVTDPPELDPEIAVSAAQLSRSSVEGENAAPLDFTVRNSGGGTLSYVLQLVATGVPSSSDIVNYILGFDPDATGKDLNLDTRIDSADVVMATNGIAAPGWASLNPTSGDSTGEADTITITFDSAALGIGTYTADILVSGNAANSPRRIPLELIVNSSLPSTTSVVPNPPVAGGQARVWYASEAGPISGSAQYVLHWGINGGLAAGGTWEQVTDTAMTDAGSGGMWYADIALPFGATSLNFVVNTGGASPQWDNNGGQDWNFAVTPSPTPSISVNSSSLSRTVTEGGDAADIALEVSNGSGGTLDYSLSLVDTGDGTGWLEAVPATGQSTGAAQSHTVSFSSAALAAGTYQAEIEVADPNASNSPVAVTVTLAVEAAASNTPITIGAGPVIGTNVEGVSYNEEFQDWNAGDLRALDAPDDASDLGDGHKWARDLVAFYSRLEDGNLFLRVDLLELGIEAEEGNLDVYVLIDCAAGGTTTLPDGVSGTTTRAWDVAVATYDSASFRAIDSAGATIGGAHLGAYFNSALDAAEFGVTQQALLDAGWDGSSTLHFNVFTAKDFNAQATDSFGLSGSIAGDASPGRAKFATIAHGNQSLNRGDGIRDRIYISAANTGVGAPSGFRLTLDTHTIFDIPLNIHMSATLISAIRWIEDANPVWDGAAFLGIVGDVIDADQSEDPGALIGGVFSEHIMPFFVGDINRNSIEHFDALTNDLWGVTGAEMKVMHIPERVTDVVGSGLDPFDDVAASAYTATYIDEVAHVRDWFYPGDAWSGIGGSGELPRQHKIHLLNGVYCFLINDKEDQFKFWPQDGGANLDWRFSLLEKARHADQAQLTLIFDDWEAMAGYSFGSGFNDNALNYNAVMRWVANHPWIEVVTLREILERATDTGHPQYDAGWVVDQGAVSDKPFNTYDYLHHATENSYENWYNGSALEESFRNAVPVVDGTVDSGTALPSGKQFGGIETPGSIVADTWAAVAAAPQNPLRELAEKGYQAMIFETAWHDEDNTNYERDAGNNYHGWAFPDTSFDRVSGWAFTLHNHLRGVTITTQAASWAADVADGAPLPQLTAVAQDLDQDGQNEYVLHNDRVWMAFEARGGRCVQAYAVDPATGAPFSILGTSPINNPSAQGEEEFISTSSRCSAFKDTFGGTYADAIYNASVGAGSLTFTSQDGNIAKTISLTQGSPVVAVAYTNNLGADLYVRMGVAVNNLDLLHRGQNFASSYGATEFTQDNATLGSLTIRATSNAGINQLDDATRFVIPLTEQMEVRVGPGASTFEIEAGA